MFQSQNNGMRHGKITGDYEAVDLELWNFILKCLPLNGLNDQ